MLTRIWIDEARAAMRAGRRDEAVAAAMRALDIFERHGELGFEVTRDAVFRSGIPEMVTAFAARQRIDWRGFGSIIAPDFFGSIDVGDRAGHVEALLDAGAPRNDLLSAIRTSLHPGGRVDTLAAWCRQTARAFSPDDAILEIIPHLPARGAEAARDIARVLEEAAPRADRLNATTLVFTRGSAALAGRALVRAGLPTSACIALAEAAPRDDIRAAYATGTTRHARLALIAREPSLADMIEEKGR